LYSLAEDFSPRYECHRADLVVLDVSGLGRLFGTPQRLGEELRRAAADRGLRVQIGMAPTKTAAMVLALARPGLTVIGRGDERRALAPIAIGILERITNRSPSSPGSATQGEGQKGIDRHSAASVLSVMKQWGLKTLGDLAALPSAELSARLGQQGLVWQALARGQDAGPLVPSVADERFESSIELEWPIEGLEPLSFVLTRLLEPLSTRLERRDRGAAVLHVTLGLCVAPDVQRGDRGDRREQFERDQNAASAVSSTMSQRHQTLNADIGDRAESAVNSVYTRSLQLPAPIRDVRTLRTLMLLDLESHPPSAPIERVTIVIEPTPGRVLQHALFVRAHPAPEQVSTLIARLNALMGEDRVGAPLPVESYRPGAFGMEPFRVDHEPSAASASAFSAPSASSTCFISAVRRCRRPVPARVSVVDGRPAAVATDRHGFVGGRVLMCAGPWRSSGHWWEQLGTEDRERTPWNRDEWDVALGDGAVYRIFQDRATEGWFIDAIVD
jgi:protein ImuB